MPGKPVNVAFPGQKPRLAILDCLWDAAMTKADHGNTHGLRLKENDAEAFTVPILGRDTWNAKYTRALQLRSDSIGVLRSEKANADAARFCQGLK